MNVVWESLRGAERRSLSPVILLLCFASWAAADAPPAAGVLPKGRDGHALNTDFESGDLRDWRAEGDAFDRQPIDGDVIAQRRSDMRSAHAGRYWIGGYERVQDGGRGTLRSEPFQVTLPWAAFRVAGGAYDNCRVELVRAGDDQVVFRTTVFEPDVFQATGNASETLRPCVVDLTPHVGQELYIRLVDDQVGHWAHLNFDDFKLYAERPRFERELRPVAQGLKQLGPDEPPATDEYVHAGTTPEEAARAMTVPEGFAATLFAGEPDVQQPIAMSIDDRGRLWIAEAFSYPRRVPDEEARDRILIFEDTNGDGRFDQRKVFADKLNLVSGLELGFGGVWVGMAPQLVFIPDRDGDDRPDGPAEVLLDGWGFQDTHETLNSFTWGPDGWLYGCHGVFTHSLVGKPGAPRDQRVPINAGIWRYHPTRHEFEVYCHGTSNPWGFDFNERGESFLTACVIPHLYHVVLGGRYERQAGQHFNRYTYDDIKTIARHRHWIGATPHGGNNRSDAAGGGHAHAGAMIYQGGLWPAAYHDQIFMNNIHGARINQDLLVPDGSSYGGDHAPDFLRANDSWSQIVSLTYGPDGNVYMIDWYDKNQCHHNEAAGHDRTNGRIFKVSWKESPASAEQAQALAALPTDLRSLSTLELIALLTAPNEWHRRHARRLLQERRESDPELLAALDHMAFESPREWQRVRGLWGLHAVGALDEARLAKALACDSDAVRAWGVRLACDAATTKELLLPNGLHVTQPSSALLAEFARLAREDASPTVRLHLASNAQRMTLADRVPIVAALASRAEDANDRNLPLLVWYAAEPLAGDAPPEAFEVLRAARIPLVRGYLARRLAQADDVAVLDQLIEREVVPSKSIDDQRMLLREINAGLQGRRRVEMPQHWRQSFDALERSPDAQVQAEAVTLALTFGDERAIERRRGELADTKLPPAARLAALESLLRIHADDLAPAMHGLLGEPALAGAALRGLAAYDDPRTAQAVLAVYEGLPLEERRAALATLASRATYADALLGALEDKRIASADVSADMVRQLRNLKESELEKRVFKIWGAVNDTPADKAKLIAHWKDQLSKPGDAPDLPLGRAVFAKTCQQCHTLFGAGAKVGPELTGSNRANLDYILSNVIDPSALIGADYQAQVVVTTDGRVVTGLVKAEDDQSVTFVTGAETIVVPKAEIDERSISAKSMMPDDILQPLRPEEVKALIGYLASPAQCAMLATADSARSLFNGKDLTGWWGDMELWTVEDGEIVGRTSGLDHNEFLKSDLAVEDFRLKLEVKLVDDRGNSGVQFRSEPLPDGEMRGYQADIGVGWWGKLYEESGRALLWDRSGESHVRRGDWNTYEIEAVGPRIRTWIDGQPCVDLDDPQGARRGVLALQVHSGEATEVRFRNLELTVLGLGAAPASAQPATGQSATGQSATGRGAP